MAKKYKLTQLEVHSAHELGMSMVLSLLLKLALDAQTNRDAAADEIEDGTRQLIHGMSLKDVPMERQDEFRQAAEDRALQIVNHARNMLRITGPTGIQ